MEGLTAEALKGLIAAGPIAIMLAIAVWVLWRENRSLMDRERELTARYQQKLEEAYRKQLEISNQYHKTLIGLTED